jgi:hypothetical protein
MKRIAIPGLLVCLICLLTLRSFGTAHPAAPVEPAPKESAVRLTVSKDDEFHINNEEPKPVGGMEHKFKVNDDRKHHVLVLFKAGGVQATEANPRPDGRCILRLMVDGNEKAATHLEFHRANVRGSGLECKDASLVWLWEDVPAGEHRVWVDGATSGAGSRLSCFGSTRSLILVEVP